MHYIYKIENCLNVCYAYTIISCKINCYADNAYIYRAMYLLEGIQPKIFINRRIFTIYFATVTLFYLYVNTTNN